MNQDAAAALRDGRLDAYMRAQNVRYVIEVESVFACSTVDQDPALGAFIPSGRRRSAARRLYEVVDTTGR